MRADTNWNPGEAVAKVRAELARARRRFAARTPALRWSMGLSSIAVVIALAYAATTNSATPRGFVRSGERFGSDDLIAVRYALEAKHIPFQVDRHNRVEVALDRVDDANDAVFKRGVGPRPMAEIEKDAMVSSFLDTIGSREQKKEQAENEMLAAMLRGMDGVRDARVRVHRPASRRIGRPTEKTTASAYLEMDDDREIAGETVEKIQALIVGVAPEVKGVTVIDRKGNQYSNAANPSMGLQSRVRARREELKQEIVENLYWLKGVQVSVALIAPSATAEPAPSPTPTASTTTTEPTPATEPSWSSPPVVSVGVNQPLELSSETPALPPSPKPLAPMSTASERREPAPPRARVWVKVARSYYYLEYKKAMPRREPSPEDLQPLLDRTRLLIEAAVHHVVPQSELEILEVSTIPDDLPVHEAPPPASNSTDALRAMPWWVPAGVAGGATAAILMVTFGVIATRRPALRPLASGRQERDRYKIDEASDGGPGPSERVRELIRSNPEAAASVLHRWAGQGGDLG